MTTEDANVMLAAVVMGNLLYAIGKRVVEDVLRLTVVGPVNRSLDRIAYQDGWDDGYESRADDADEYAEQRYNDGFRAGAEQQTEWLDHKANVIADLRDSRD